ncbi:MAG TPA: AIR carboxylase family protein [Candidatus Limnocylindria bacterium]|nr:AIR carboxylase family protein [Candidatus Limnocylindria bacterium]
MKAVLILGAEADAAWAKQITDRLTALGVPWEQHVASAHRTPRKVLEIIDRYAGERRVVYVTIAGRSNALSGFVAGNTTAPVLACPPFQDQLDMLVNVHSTLQMPSQVPVLTVLDPGNCADAVKRILDVAAG